MSEAVGPRLAIVDYGMGNLFSVKHAFEHVGMLAFVTSSKQDVLEADAVVLPGVGAFGDAMESLERLDLIGPIRDVASSGKPLFGICLGMQLLMTESTEFGRHEGLGIIEGPVVRLDDPGESNDVARTGCGRAAKVPQVGWNRIYRKRTQLDGAGEGDLDRDPWSGSPLAGLTDQEFMYFVHSFYPKPADPHVVLSLCRYGNIEFCSSLMYRNVFGCQFHPERSGPQGLRLYMNIATIVKDASGFKESPVV